MGSFNPKDPEHQQGSFIKEAGRYVFCIIEIQRKDTRGGDAIIAQCECILGPHSETKMRRLFMLEGRGTRWFADLLNAVKCDYIADLMDDREMSAALGRRPFAAKCAKGDPHPTKVDRDGEPLRYMEIIDTFPIDNQEQSELQNNRFAFGIASGSSIFVDELTREKPNRSSGGNDSGGARQAGGWGKPPSSGGGSGSGSGSDPGPGYAPPPGDDDIPF